MVGLNRVQLMGNMTRDPELKTTANGGKMARIGLAVNRPYTTKDGQKKEDTTFLTLVAYDKKAEILGQYATKGTSLYIEGRIKVTKQTNDKGESRTFTDFVIENFQFLGGNKKANKSETPDHVETVDSSFDEFLEDKK